ncbi:hypothetical protein [Haloferula sargassicola]|uniref:Uncharacterized protein n=1 Tax=Haloferula sargassicola TaxID=490096 RepID=A0ABP9URA2_9BACT
MPNAAPKKPDPHPGVAAAAISLMAMAVAGVLELIGLTSAWDRALLERMKSVGLEGGVAPLEAWIGWLWAAVVIVLSTWVLLHVRGGWRRWVLAVSMAVVSLAWIPVMALCGRVPMLSAPAVGVLWALGGSLVYAARHREPK